MQGSRSAFTLIELLIVLALSGLFASYAIIGSNVSRNVVALSVESSEVAQVILQAKQLAIATYTAGDSASCGFGVLLDQSAGTYSIFSYSPVTSPTPCPQASSLTSINPDFEKQYTVGTWQVSLHQGVKFDLPNTQEAILFYPPDPTVFLSDDGTNIQSIGPLRVGLVTADGNSSTTISINTQGQISTQ